MDVTHQLPMEQEFRVWPKSSSRSAPPPEVPEALANDYREAATILSDSPRASAALARRCLQALLTDHMNATGQSLEKQIDSVIDTLPSHASTPLHALRNIGNFAAHPTKDQQTGAIVDVEPGEAEWTLDTLDALFDFVFVAPAKQQERLAALNQRLAAAGKPQLDKDGKPTKT